MDIAQANSLQDQSQECDISVLLDWVYYHNALSRFTQHHLRRKPLALESTNMDDSGADGLQYQSLTRDRCVCAPSDDHELSLTHSQVTPSPNPAHAILNLLTEICDTVVDPRDPSSRNEEHQGRLRALEGKLGSLSITPAAAADTNLLPVNMYEISTRIYLARASQSPWELPTRLDSLIEMAFSLASSGSTCKHFFPLFVVACEARTDERRVAILGLIDSTANSGLVRSMEGLRAVIESIWVQQDLHADNELLPDYLGIMSSAISSSDVIPSFV
jgi:hypothetical protein